MSSSSAPGRPASAERCTCGSSSKTTTRAQLQAPGSSTPISIAVIEKGREIGAHTLSGAILDPVALKELLPNYQDLGAPLGTPVTHDTVCFLTAADKFALPFIPPPLRNHGNSIISLNRFVKWMGGLAESRGIDLFPGFAGTELLFDGKRLIGVRTGDRGIGKDGQPLASFEPGVDILAKAVVFGEGVRGSLTKQLISRLQLDAGKSPQVYAIGVKEVWELPEESCGEGPCCSHAGLPSETGKLWWRVYLQHGEDALHRAGRRPGLSRPLPRSAPGISALQDAPVHFIHAQERQDGALWRQGHSRGRLLHDPAKLFRRRPPDRRQREPAEFPAAEGHPSGYEVRNAGGRNAA